jgi:hypothetical protein
MSCSTFLEGGGYILGYLAGDKKSTKKLPANENSTV